MKTLNEYLTLPYRMEIVEDHDEGGPSDVLLPLLIEFITADKILIIIRCIAMII